VIAHAAQVLAVLGTGCQPSHTASELDDVAPDRWVRRVVRRLSRTASERAPRAAVRDPEGHPAGPGAATPAPGDHEGAPG